MKTNINRPLAGIIAIIIGIGGVIYGPNIIGGGGGTGTCPLPAFPDASCTGVPAGTTLTAYTGPTTITTNGTVIDSKTVNGCLAIKANNVIIRKSKITCTAHGVECDTGTGTDCAGGDLLVEDSEFDCQNAVGGSAIVGWHMTIRRNNIHNCENGGSLDQNVSFTDNYVHGLVNCVPGPCVEPGAPHSDGIESPDGSNMTIQHNTIIAYTLPCPAPPASPDECNSASAAININNSAGGPHTTNTLVQDNLVAGGQVVFLCPIPTTTNVRYINNHIPTEYSPTGAYGATGSDCAGETQSGNVFYPSGTPVTLG